jgi:RNA-directed DNA polymerase
LRGYRVSIRPSKDAVKRHGWHLRQVVHRGGGISQDQLIAELNPVIAGWSNYYRGVAATRTFSLLDHHLFLRLRHWAAKRHRTKAPRWVVGHYWRPEHGRWCFATPDGRMRLNQHAKTRIQLHIQVKGDRSPYDGDWSYWATRLGRHPELPRRVALLLHQQQGRCRGCGLRFTMEDQWEIDHIEPAARGGTDRFENLQLLHHHCHDRKTAQDGPGAAGVHDKDRTAEEPDEAKVSRPVLHGGGAG